MTSTPPDAPESPAPGPDPDPAGSGPRVSREEMTDLTRLRRTVGSDRVIAGVAGGIARHLDIDPIIVRVVLGVSVFLGGAGLLVYAACWLFVPEEGSPRAVWNIAPRNRHVILVIAGVLALIFATGATAGQHFPWALAIVAAAVIAWLMLRDRPAAGTGPAVGPAVGSAPTAPPMTSSSPSAYVPQPVRPADPRKKGPVLFGFVLAGSLLALGVLGMIDLSGVDVPPSAYPAAVTGVATLGLLLGAFWGRAGGLIALVLVGLLATAVTGVGERAAGTTTFAPPLAAQVEGSYTTGAGDMVINLGAVQDPAGLAGRTISVRAGLARLVVVAPDGLNLRIHATVGGPGSINLLGIKSDGINLVRTSGRTLTGAPGTLALDIQLGVGEIDVITPADYASGNYSH